MAYDPELAERVRGALAAEPDLSEKRMFGGPAFLIAGRMAVVISRAGGLMIRTVPGSAAPLRAPPPRP